MQQGDLAPLFAPPMDGSVVDPLPEPPPVEPPGRPEAALGADLEPTYGAVHASSDHHLSVEVADLPVTEARPWNPPPTILFRPEVLEVHWRNRALLKCLLKGPRLNPDGTQLATGETANRPFHVEIGGRRVLAEDTPPWIVALVTRYTPLPFPPGQE